MTTPSKGAAGRLLRPVLILVVAQLVAGVLAGLIWLAWAPRTTLYAIADGTSSLVIPAETENEVAADGRYFILTTLLGLALGLVAWRLRAVRGPVTLLLVAAVGFAGSLAARAVAAVLSHGPSTAAAGQSFRPPLSLHATAMLWAQPFVAVLVYVAAVGLCSDPALRGFDSGPGGPDSGPGGPDLPGPDPDLQDPDLPGPDTDLQDPDLPGPGPDLQDPDLPGPDLTGPRGAGEPANWTPNPG